MEPKLIENKYPYLWWSISPSGSELFDPTPRTRANISISSIKVEHIYSFWNSVRLLSCTADRALDGWLSYIYIRYWVGEYHRYLFLWYWIHVRELVEIRQPKNVEFPNTLLGCVNWQNSVNGNTLNSWIRCWNTWIGRNPWVTDFCMIGKEMSVPLTMREARYLELDFTMFSTL